MDMNKWFYRAVGTVGVASGFLVLAGGAAQADEADAAQPAVDPQQLRGLLDTLFTPTAGALPAAPLPSDRAADAVDSPAPTDTPVGVAGNNLFVQGPLPDVLRRVPLHALPAAPQPATPRTTESGPVDQLGGLPVIGGLLNGPLSGLGQTPVLPGAPALPGGSALPGASAPPGADRTAGDPTTEAPLSHDSAMLLDGVEPVQGGPGLLDTLPLHSTDTNLPVRSSHLNADPVLPPGLLPDGVRPRVQTGTVGTELPVAGPVRVDSTNGTARVPALIGDALAAERTELFGAPTEAGLPLLGSLPLVGSLGNGGPGLPGASKGGLPLGGLPLGGVSPTNPLGGVSPTNPLGGAAATNPLGGVTSGLPGRHARPAAPGRHAADQTAQLGRHAAEQPGRHAAPDDSSIGDRGRRIVGSPGGRAAERPVAGEDADFS
jgi:hypothetical protein